jgi:hypothetical protein
MTKSFNEVFHLLLYLLLEPVTPAPTFRIFVNKLCRHSGFMAGAGILSFLCGILTAICLALSQGYAAGQLYGLTKYIDSILTFLAL